METRTNSPCRYIEKQGGRFWNRIRRYIKSLSGTSFEQQFLNKNENLHFVSVYIYI